MGVRHIIAWAILAFLAVAGVVVVWLIATSRRRQRRRENREFDRATGRVATPDDD